MRAGPSPLHVRPSNQGRARSVPRLPFQGSNLEREYYLDLCGLDRPVPEAIYGVHRRPIASLLCLIRFQFQFQFHLLDTRSHSIHPTSIQIGLRACSTLCGSAPGGCPDQTGQTRLDAKGAHPARVSADLALLAFPGMASESSYSRQLAMR